MHVVTEKYILLGKIEEHGNGKIILNKRFDPGAIVDADNDGAKRLFIMEYGIGDTITFNSSERHSPGK